MESTFVYLFESNAADAGACFEMDHHARVGGEFATAAKTFDLLGLVDPTVLYHNRQWRSNLIGEAYLLKVVVVLELSTAVIAFMMDGSFVIL